ncbi:hypothetical protein BWI96_11885 [Siphonobacter sp. SORGH_AS_0500]|uniref:hypothetical protein n=1 Tax=Siphonobacter sp. SORGH_AS_0500 TaxID=1864824 RepID=UPI000CAF736F|nr:hypothetical protein [Siphonobacter sp. SORGH_AS_0500]PKK36548.1 hypothetical protein BWI96_11885 [Siphonobacter sp. SORGH_AS_0500]
MALKKIELIEEKYNTGPVRKFVVLDGLVHSEIDLGILNTFKLKRPVGRFDLTYEVDMTFVHGLHLINFFAKGGSLRKELFVKSYWIGANEVSKSFIEKSVRLQRQYDYGFGNITQGPNPLIPNSVPFIYTYTSSHVKDDESAGLIQAIDNFAIDLVLNIFNSEEVTE